MVSRGQSSSCSEFGCSAESCWSHRAESLWNIEADTHDVALSNATATYLRYVPTTGHHHRIGKVQRQSQYSIHRGEPKTSWRSASLETKECAHARIALQTTLTTSCRLLWLPVDFGRSASLPTRAISALRDSAWSPDHFFVSQQLICSLIMILAFQCMLGASARKHRGLSIATQVVRIWSATHQRLILFDAKYAYQD